MAQDKAVFDILPIVVKKGLLNETVSAIDIFDLDFFESRINALKVAFPEEFCCHTLALKANPIRGVVQFAIKHGLGGEAASICETLHALSLGIEPCKVIFDSPCKTRSDLRQAMLHGVQINLDNDLELELVDELLKEVGETNSSFGLRVNPGVGSGSLAFTSTATKNSKFGHPIFGDKKRQVIELFHKYKWLSGIHVHVGSQGVPMTLFQAGAQVCMDFVQDLESEGIKIKTVNIGGGLTSSYEHAEDSTEFTFANYRKILESSIPQLFSGRYQVVTEFGRSLLLKAGTTLSKVELVKQWIPENVPIVMAHVGANQFFTEVYLPQTRKHRFDLVDEQGMPKDTSSSKTFDIAGPLCFQGDYLAKNVQLPETARSGDILIMHETGAYTMSMYSKFNSNIPSPVYGFSIKEGNKIWCLKERETLEETLSFWGCKQPLFL